LITSQASVCIAS